MVQSANLTLDQANEALGLTPATGLAKPDPTRFTMGRKMKAAFRLENTYASFYANSAADPQVPTKQEETAFKSGDWKPLDAVKGSLLDTPDYWGRVAETRSARELSLLTSNVQREREDRAVLNTLGFFPTLGYTMVAATLDPVTAVAAMIPGVLTARGARALAVGVGMSTTTEALLQSSQQERTLEETAYNIAGDFIIGGVLGHLGNKVSGEQRAKAVEEYDEMRIVSKAADEQQYYDNLLRESGEVPDAATLTDEDFVNWWNTLTTDPDAPDTPPASAGAVEVDPLAKYRNPVTAVAKDNVEPDTVVVEPDTIVAGPKAKAKPGEEIDERFEFEDTEDEVLGIDADGNPILASDQARPGIGTGVGSNFNDELVEQILPGRLAEVGKRIDAGDLTPGAAGRMVFNELKNALKLKSDKFIKIFKYAHPALELALSESPTMRIIGMKMSEDAYVRGYNEQGGGLDIQPLSVIVKDLEQAKGNVPIRESFERNYASYLKTEFKMQDYTGLHGAKQALDAKRNDLMTADEFDQATFDAITSNGGEHEIPEIQAYAAEIKKVIDYINEQQVDSGLIKADALEKAAAPAYGDKGVVPRIYNVNEIDINSRSFIKIATDDFIKFLETEHPDLLADIRAVQGWTKDELNFELYDDLHLLASTFHTKVVKSPTGFVATNGILYKKDGMFGDWFGGLRFDITTKSLQGDPKRGVPSFIETDLRAVMGVWLRNMAPRIGLARQFEGDIEMKQVKEDLQLEFDDYVESALQKEFGDEYIELRSEENPSKTMDEQIAFERKIRAKFAREMRTLENMRQYALHEFDNPADPTSLLSTILKATKWLNFITKLGGMGLSSITDMGSTIIKVGAMPFARSMANMAISMGAGMARHEALKWGAGIDVIIASRMNQIGMLDDVTSFRKADKFMAKSSQVFSKLTVMAQWNAIMKQLAALSTGDTIARLAMKEVLTPKEIGQLSRMGINQKNWADLRVEIQNHNKAVDGWTIPDIDNFESEHLADLFTQAAIREADTAIVTPGGGDIPFATRTQLGQVVFQFKSFLFTTNNRVVIPGIQNRDANTVIGAMSMVALGAASFAMKEIAAGRGDDLKNVSADQWVKEGVDRSGVVGLLWSFDSLLADVSGGEFSAQTTLLGDVPVVNVMAQSTVNDLAGPWLGSARDLASASRAIYGALSNGEIKESDIGAGRRLIPLQNMFYLTRGFNAVETAIGGREFE